MSKPKYIYVDDENDESVEAIVSGFNDLNEIEVELFPLEETRDFETLKKNLAEIEFDGLILDLRLDGEGPNRVEFSAPTIAQDIRTTSARNEIKSCPIILCSTEPKIRETYNADKSSHNLFDYKFEKSEEPDYPKFSNKLHSLSTGYNWINDKDRSIQEILDRKDLSGIDARIYEDFITDGFGPYSAHDYSKFVITNLFHHPGALIKERTVAARLGVDISNSPDWNDLKEGFLTQSRYSGIFADGWKRWWADRLIDSFKEISQGEDLASLKASQRVEIISNLTGLKKLMDAKPIDLCTSTEFWAICEGYKRPIDPLEGLIVFEKSRLQPWQENKYISFHAAEVERIGRARGLKPHPFEAERIAEIKQTISK